ncbi:hypothetical protein K9N68_24080 [Kovacikia minuta CCNUW1]|uniref:hypothetical protein n=1 Tax=Kovacikia minuta TaxID=2931930 RepID=UPI001CC91E19|nr:hypothetical protein [Kovacikia minuta]UBF24723.1 hypothetical protein K9N68_24080 [Kovacikia minuta CCNUW1]
MMNSFIPNEIAVAPNPLALTPNLKLTTIPIDAYTCFELWIPANILLLPEEAMLLKGDRSRLEEICARLTWLVGARFVGNESQTPPVLIYDWREVQSQIRTLSEDFNAIGVTYLPQAISPDAEDDISPSWTLRPPSWNISLLSLKPVSSGFGLEILPFSLSISLGESVTRREKGAAILID